MNQKELIEQARLRDEEVMEAIEKARSRGFPYPNYSQILKDAQQAKDWIFFEAGKKEERERIAGEFLALINQLNW